jgi:hypothetical protein
MKDTELVGAVAQHLRSKGVRCKIAIEPKRSLLGTPQSQLVILLAGEEVSRIEVARHAAYGCHWFDCRFGILVNGPLGEADSEAVKARTRVIREGKFLRMLGGEIVGVTWVGGRISKPLSREVGLSQVLLDLARHCRVEKVLIEPRGETKVDIVCPDIPDVDVPWAIDGGEEYHYLGQGLGLDWGVLLELCSRIARRVRCVVGRQDSIRTWNVDMLGRLGQPWGTMPLPTSIATISGGWLADGC